uniref:Uncharacterized protein n=1 Tax=Glossina austeni TaxID=7395 RepID=A0A1A9UYD1_GLOAU
MLEDFSQQTMNEPVHILLNVKHNTAPMADIVHIFSQTNTLPIQKPTKVPKTDKRPVVVLRRGSSEQNTLAVDEEEIVKLINLESLIGDEENLRIFDAPTKTFTNNVLPSTNRTQPTPHMIDNEA